jgi:peptide/nickel transport system substrate-binding protein
VEAKPNFQLMYFGFKTTRPLVSDKRVREAMSIGINRAETRQGDPAGQADPAYTYVDPDALDFDPKTKGIINEDVEPGRRSCSTKRAGCPAPTVSARRTASSACSPRSTSTQVGNTPRMPKPSRATCARSASTGRSPRWTPPSCRPSWRSQDFDLWTVTVPYLSAGDLMNFYFDSKQIPVPNRMNWKDAETDEWLASGPLGADRGRSGQGYAMVQEKVTRSTCGCR